MLEQRWAVGGQELFETERRQLGDLAGLDQPGARATVPSATGTGADVVTLLDHIREDDSRERIWHGVESITARPGGAVIEFHRGHDPVLRPEGGAEVACHLYDPELADARSAGWHRGQPNVKE
jgi:peptide/nickel transport system ATP-binding protein